MRRRQTAVETPPQTLPHFLLVKTMQHVLLGCRKAGEGGLCVHGDWGGVRVRVHEVEHARSVRNAGVGFANNGLAIVTKQSRHHAAGVGVLRTPSARERSKRLRIERRLTPGTEGPASRVHDRTPAASEGLRT